MSKRDYYEVLGVDRGADAAALKKAYRRMAQKHHPDRNPDDAESEHKFKEAKEAYEVLNNPQKRSAFDQFGHAGVDPSMGGGPGGPGPGGFGDVFGDVFGDIFGGGRGRQGGVYRGADLRYSMELNLEEAAAGKTINIKIPARVKCGVCNGSGAKKGSSPKTCNTCNGHGQVRMQQGFSRFSKPVRHVMAREPSSPIPAVPAVARARYNKRKPCRLKFRPVLILVTAFVWQGKERQEKKAGRPVIYMLRSRSGSIRFLPVRTVICIVKYRSVLSRLHWEALLKYRH